jgi:predicted DNA-binding protein
MISVRLEPSMENQLNLIAKQQDIPKSQVIKESLSMYFDMLEKEQNKKSPYELGSELFGKYSSGETDRSTTYKQKLKDRINAKNNNR